MKEKSMNCVINLNIISQTRVYQFILFLMFEQDIHSGFVRQKSLKVNKTNRGPIVIQPYFSFHLQVEHKSYILGKNFKFIW